MIEPPLRALLFSPLRGLDPASGDLAYTEALLAAPPANVEYTTYRDAIADGTVKVRGRRPRHGSFRAIDLALLGARSMEVALRRNGLLYREPYWYVTVDPSAYDLIHTHLFAIRQVGSNLPVVSSDGYPLGVLYEHVDGWSPRRVAAITRAEEFLAATTRTHVPGLWGPADHIVTVYSHRFRNWLALRGRNRARVEVIGNALQPLALPTRRSDGRTLAFVGRNFRSKGGDIALGAFDLLRREHGGLSLIVATSSTSAPPELASTPGVELLLDASRDEVLHDVYPRADVLLLPTRSDCGAPYGLLEALQSGLSVVASDFPWLDERLVPPAVDRVGANPGAVAEAAARLLSQPASERTENARTLWSNEFSTDKLGQGLVNCYRAAVGRDRVATRKPHVLIAARPMDLAHAVENAFVRRHQRMVADLRTVADVSIVGLRHWHDTTQVDHRFADLPYLEVEVPKRPASRGARVRRGLTGVLKRRDLEPWERDLSHVAEQFGADVAVCIGPWEVQTYRALTSNLPAVLVYEEDLRRMPDLEPQSRQARALRAVEAAADYRAGLRPEVVGVICDPEFRGARRRFPGAQVEILPFTLPVDEWPVSTSPSDGDYLLAVANFAEERNAEGLVEVLHCLSRAPSGPPPVKIVSASGVTPPLREFLESNWVELVPPVKDLMRLYRGARMAVVPATRATGFKTTILQGWISGCPVVCSDVAAATISQSSRNSVATGSTPSEIASKIIALWDDRERRHALALAGSETARQEHDDLRERRRFVDRVVRLSESRLRA